MWQIECYPSMDDALNCRNGYYYGECPDYRSACFYARQRAIETGKVALVIKVGGVPKQHHIDNTKTTGYYGDKYCSKAERFFW